MVPADGRGRGPLQCALIDRATASRRSSKHLLPTATNRSTDSLDTQVDEEQFYKATSRRRRPAKQTRRTKEGEE